MQSGECMARILGRLLLLLMVLLPMPSAAAGAPPSIPADAAPCPTNLGEPPFRPITHLGIDLADKKQVDTRLDNYAVAMECLRRDVRYYLKAIAARPNPDFQTLVVALNGIQAKLDSQATVMTQIAEKLPTAGPGQRAGDTYHINISNSGNTRTDTNTSSDSRSSQVVSRYELPRVAEPEGAGTPAAGKEEPKAPRQAQIRPVDPVMDHFADFGAIRFAVAAVPDPRVPRHGRAYDNDIAAIMAGMLRAGYVLDRYNFPWQSVLLNRRKDNPDVFEPALADDGRFGLMIFRRDQWRRVPAADPRPDVFALYVVAETATAGVASRSLKCAMRRIASQLPQGGVSQPPQGNVSQPPQGNASQPPQGKPVPADADNECGSQPVATGVDDRALLAGGLACKEGALLVLGPHFSGSMDSLAQAARESIVAAGPGIRRLCTVSGTATAATNGNIEGTGGQGLLQYQTLATSDEDKLRRLQSLVVDRLGLELGDVAFLAESSVFGMEVCPQASTLELCRQGALISFPANIADVRYRLRQRQEESLKDFQELRMAAGRLALEDGAENGSEFPEGQQARLTDVAVEMQLQAALEQLQDSGARVVVVVATDVRDRLFLFDRVKAVLPDALLVDMETDRLLGHVDFIHATRGTLTLASSTLKTDWVPARKDEESARKDGKPARKDRRPATWATDGQGLLACAAFSVADAGSVAGAGEPMRYSCEAWHTPAKGRVQWHVVTRQGLKPLPVPSEGSVEDYAWLVPVLMALLLIGGYLILKVGGSDSFGDVRLRLRSASWPLRIVSLGMLVFASGMAALVIILALQGASLVVLGIDLRYVLLGIDPRYGLGTLGLCLLALLQVAMSWRLSGYLVNECVAGDVAAAGVSSGLTARGYLRNWNLRWVCWVATSIYLLWLLSVAWYGPRPSLYGQAAAWAAFGGPAFATLAAFLFLGIATGSACRLRLLVRSLREKATLGAALPRKDEEIPTLRWAGSGEAVPDSAGTPSQHWQGRLPDFASTPVLASLRDLGTHAAEPALQAEALQALVPGNIGITQRFAMYALLAREVGILRWAAISGFLSAFAAILMIYLSPVTAGDKFLLMNFLLLLAAGIGGGLATVVMERNAVLSNILCDAPATLQWSTSLLCAIAAPAVVIAAAFAILEMPGVMTWSGGIFSWLLAWVGYPS